MQQPQMCAGTGQAALNTVREALELEAAGADFYTANQNNGKQSLDGPLRGIFQLKWLVNRNLSYFVGATFLGGCRAVSCVKFNQCKLRKYLLLLLPCKRNLLYTRGLTKAHEKVLPSKRAVAKGKKKKKRSYDNWIWRGL
jgi:hypothetical protein